MGIKIGEIAKRSGVPVSTIRFYVKEGLLPFPEKVNKKMAYYDESCIKEDRGDPASQGEEVLSPGRHQKHPSPHGRWLYL